MNSYAISLLNLEQQHGLASSYRGSNVVVTGGASFIGSHLVDALLELGANVLVLDNFSSGKMENLQSHKNLVVREIDLRSNDDTRTQINGGFDYVFHLAAVHGGRGFIESQHSAMMENFALDFNVYSASLKSRVKRIVNTSSACAYPIGLQDSTIDRLFLDEDSSGFSSPEKSFPDGKYGWIKLMGEFQLETILEGQTETQGRSARVFTAYGERENESHAAIALIAKSLLKMNPFPVWGSGMQTRNFTYVSDTVTGLLLLGVDDRNLVFDVFNVGTDVHNTVLEFINAIHEAMGWTPTEFEFQLDKPMGVASRASDNRKLFDTFGWQPGVDIVRGIRRTFDWYQNLESRPRTIAELELKLSAR